jgi:hypothetical protein
MHPRMAACSPHPECCALCVCSRALLPQALSHAAAGFLALLSQRAGGCAAAAKRRTVRGAALAP